ncbi:MAG: DNA polymerase III subunit chi [Deferrisomatales bacterium]|nr:DNA polymerase III subunit chi [Deferrisomatales bacterium]
MPRADFYEIRGPRWELALCRQVEAAYEAGERVCVQAGSEAEARRLDELLWTFRDEAFVPHDLCRGELRATTPVAVGWRPGNPNDATCLVLARDAAPQEAVGFDRVVDFAPVDMPDLVALTRRRYRAFRDAGFAVAFHKAPD